MRGGSLQSIHCSLWRLLLQCTEWFIVSCINMSISSSRLTSWRRTWTTPTPWGPVLPYEHGSTWFPPLFGFTNTSRGFMSWEGRGFTRNGFQRPSSSWETQQRTTELLMEMKLSASWPPIQSRKEHNQLYSKYKQIHISKIINMMQTSLE